MHVPKEAGKKSGQVHGVRRVPEITTEGPNIIQKYAPTLRWSRIRERCHDAFSEFFGTLILILFGNGVVAQVVLSNYEKGNYQSISWGWG